MQRRWSWPGPNKRPVYNFPSEGREFASNRCLIVADGFYEFTGPEDPKKKRKDKWLFTKKDELIFCIAGIWRDTPEVGKAFTMLTMAPGPDSPLTTIGRSSSWNAAPGQIGLTPLFPESR
ncbi:SOS response-associated peptidase family protein [Rhizobium paranaense]|nr:putative SOS response-associated peptidase YedK [Rhizobium paranaense]